MNLFGIGGAELVVILVIMLVVAGPKRMIQWTYQLGRLVSKAQKMWRETAILLQKEFDAAGVEIEVPQNIPTRDDLKKQVMKMAAPVTNPITDTAREIDRELKQDVDNLRLSTQIDPARKKPPMPKSVTLPGTGDGAPDTNGQTTSEFGTWSGNNSGSNQEGT
jgi:Sec-independent protein translocase protein TatA